MSTPIKHSVLVIGCGRIAGGSEFIIDRELKLTHAWAYTNHDLFQIDACIEPDHSRRKLFMERWGVKNGFSNLEEYKKEGLSCDVASICSPSNTHADILNDLVTSPLSAIFCEKPFTTDINKSKILIDKYKKAKIPIAVAYLRRWNQSIHTIKHELDNLNWGKVRGVTGYYTKGVLNNGSHLLDLINFLLGKLEIVTVTNKRIDYDICDPTIDAVLCDKDSVPIHLIGMDSNDYTLFELHLHCEKGVVSIEQSGQIIRRRTITEDIHHTGYKQLQSGVWDNQKYINPYMSALDNLNAVIQGTDVLKSDSESAYYVQSICSELIDRAKAL